MRESARSKEPLSREIVMSFKDRSDAGRKLALALRDYKNRQPVVLALPRGGSSHARARSRGGYVGLYLPILAAQFVVPEKIRLFAIIGAMLVVIGTALEIGSVWPTQDIDAVQSTNNSE